MVTERPEGPLGAAMAKSPKVRGDHGQVGEVSQNGGKAGFSECAEAVASLRSFWKGAKLRFSPPYGPWVDRFLGWVASEGLLPDATALQGWLACKIEGGSAASSVCGYFYACKTALVAWQNEQAKHLPQTEAALLGWTLEQELKRIQLPKVMKGKRAKMILEFKTEDLDRVIRAATRRNGTIIEFLADTGLRVQELCDLRVSWVRPYDAEKSYVTVHGKGRKERAVFVFETLLSRVRRVFGGQEYLFETSTGRPLDPDNVYKEIRRTFLREGGFALTPHNLRHYLATRLLRAGASTRAVGELLGHSDPSTTANSYDVSTIRAEQLKTQHHGERGRKKGNKS